MDVLMSVALVIAQAQAAGCVDSGAAQAKLMAATGRPATTTEVLRNFKLALDNDLFLRDDFYIDQNLGKFLVANKISWDEVTPARTFGRVVSQYSFDFWFIHGTIDAQGNVVATNKMRAGGAFNADIAADLIVKLFGPPMKVTDPYAAEDWRHPTPVIKKTHELGNLAVEYSFDRPASTASLRCIFQGDGALKSCGFTNVEK